MHRFAPCLILLLPLLLTAQSADSTAERTAAPNAESVLFDTPPLVETAALYAQTLQDAPAKVTVIREQQIRTYGWRTLAEVLSNVPGFHVSTDGAYQYVGVRGFSLPGDYNTRILVLLNGHPLTDNIYGAMSLFGQEFGVDMDLVQKIEIVRGPSSAIYGSNGMFATVNIFTRAPADAARMLVSTEAGSFGEKKMLVSASMYLGSGANLLISGSGFQSTGRTADGGALGRTDSVGAEHGYHTFAQLTWRDWSFTANFSDRKVIAPFGFFSADFGDTGTSAFDAHNYIEAALMKTAGTAAEIRWRVYYDQYRYFGRYTQDGGARDNRDYARGDWIGTQFAYRRTAGVLRGLTFGSQLNADVRNTQTNEYVSPAYELVFAKRERDSSYGLFGQYERNLGKKWVLFGGVRLDDSRLDRPFVSPKVAVIWKPAPGTSYKLMYGRAFRNPSTYERYWEPNPALAAESMNTFEITREQQIFRNLNLIASVFHYRIAGLINGVMVRDGVLQYQNAEAASASGFSLEANGRPARWLETSASFGVQHTRYVNPHRDLPNSPEKLGQFRAAVPLARNHLTMSVAARYMGARLSPYGYDLDPVALADITATTNRLHRNFDLQFGIRNVTNRRYADPLSTEHLTEVLPRAGRSMFFKLIWRYGE